MKILIFFISVFFKIFFLFSNIDLKYSINLIFLPLVSKRKFSNYFILSILSKKYLFLFFLYYLEVFIFIFCKSLKCKINLKLSKFKSETNSELKSLRDGTVIILLKYIKICYYFHVNVHLSIDYLSEYTMYNINKYKVKSSLLKTSSKLN